MANNVAQGEKKEDVEEGRGQIKPKIFFCWNWK
jgi:hypothetical protein